MSKGGQQQTYGLPTMTQSTSTTSIPSWMSGASQTGVNAASRLLANPGQAYTGQLAPGMTADQMAAGDMIRNSVGGYQGYFDRAAGLTDAATQQGPQIEAQTFRNGLSGISSYMNPYISNVVDSVSALGRRNLDAALTQTADQAIGAKAFGGSRHGVREGVATAENNLNTNNLVANLLSQGYGQAASMLGQDISNNMQAQGANQSAYSNYLNRLMGAGSQMSQLGTANRAANTADVNNLLQFGSMQQDTATRQAQAAYQEFLRQQQLPYQALQAYNQTLQTSPYEKTTSTSGYEMAPMTQQQSNPLMGAIGGALSGAKLGGTLLPGGWGAGLGAIGGGLLGAFS